MSGIVDNIRKSWHTFLPLPVKYGPDFRKIFEFVQEFQYRSAEEIEEYQWQRLTAIVAYAFQHVPYYQQSFKKAGIHPGEIRNREDFRAIPVLLKEDVADNMHLLKSDQFDKLKPLATVTSSTTRDGLQIYRSLYSEMFRRAIVWRHYHNIGYKFREKRAQLTGPISFTKSVEEIPLDLNENNLIIDSRSIKPENTRNIYDKLREFSPKMLFCQPSNTVLLVEYCLQQNLTPFHIPIVYTTGEKLYPEYREAIQGFFGSKLTDYFANRENTASASQLEDGRLYINSDFCYLEFENSQGESTINEEADIISTGFENYAFPLIRYHTEDVGINRGCLENGVRNFPVMDVVGGRGKDLLLTKEGLTSLQVGPTFKAFGFHHFKRTQLEQVSIDELIVRFVPTPEYDDYADRKMLQKSFQEFFKNQFKINIEPVETFDNSRGGKYKYVISPLAIAHLRESLQKRRHS